jgi:hypothetical protein
LLCKLHSSLSAPEFSGALRAIFLRDPLTSTASRRPWRTTANRDIIRGRAIAFLWVCVIGMRIIKPSVDSSAGGCGDDKQSKRTIITAASAFILLVLPSSRPDQFNAFNITAGQSFHNPNKMHRLFRLITGEIR